MVGNSRYRRVLQESENIYTTSYTTVGGAGEEHLSLRCRVCIFKQQPEQFLH